MPLHWNAEACEPATCDDEVDRRDNLVWATMCLGLSSITAKNIGEWLWRAEFAKRLGFDCTTVKYMKHEEPLTVADLRRWTGLYTNASNETRPAFVKKVMGEVTRIIDRQVKNELKVLEACK
jgi:hypothetical protein